MEKGSVIPSSEILIKLESILNVSEAELTENDLFTRSSKEIELLEFFSYRNNFIASIHELLEHGKEYFFLSLQ